jgi:hypothetical protein
LHAAGVGTDKELLEEKGEGPWLIVHIMFFFFAPGIALAQLWLKAL